MKRIALVMSILIIFAIFTFSPLFASPPRVVYNVQSVLTFFYHYIIPLPGSFCKGLVIFPDRNVDEGQTVGGDADDYANGRRDDSMKDGDDKDSIILRSGRTTDGSQKDSRNIYRANGQL